MAVRHTEASETVNEIFHFMPALKLDQVETPGGVMMLVRGLHHAPHLQQFQDFSIAPDEVRQQCVALMRVT
jgi:enolase